MALYQNSDKTVSYSLPGVPAGQTVTKAILMLKRQEADPDADALVKIEATTQGGNPGDLMDSGSGGTAQAAFTIRKDDLDGVVPSLYFLAVKVVLANGAAYEAPTSRETVILRGGVIDQQD